MATSFPTSIQDLDATRGTTGQTLASPNHITHHALEDDTLEALQAKVGADSSAVTTSHDYKLSGVTGTDKAVSKTGTETLTNKTLTTPAITTPTFTLGSDATGDVWYRHSDGTMKRLAIGSASQVLNVTGGIPAWRDETAVINANTTTKGVTELATAAEITAGTATGATGAGLTVTPDQLALSTPVFNGSGLTALPAIAALREDTPNTATSFGTYFTSILTIDADVGWTITGSSVDRTANSISISQLSSNCTAYASLIGRSNSANGNILWNSGIDVKMSYWMINSLISAGTSAYGADDVWFWHGFNNPGTSINTHANITNTTDARVGFAHYDGRIYTVTCSGSATTSTDIQADAANTKRHFMIDFTPSSVKFYINGSLVATHTTNIPSNTDPIGIEFGGANFNNSATTIAVSQITFSETLS